MPLATPRASLGLFLCSFPVRRTRVHWGSGLRSQHRGVPTRVSLRGRRKAVPTAAPAAGTGLESGWQRSPEQEGRDDRRSYSPERQDPGLPAGWGQPRGLQRSAQGPGPSFTLSSCKPWGSWNAPQLSRRLPRPSGSRGLAPLTRGLPRTTIPRTHCALNLQPQRRSCPGGGNRACPAN